MMSLLSNYFHNLFVGYIVEIHIKTFLHHICGAQGSTCIAFVLSLAIEE